MNSYHENPPWNDDPSVSRAWKQTHRTWWHICASCTAGRRWSGCQAICDWCNAQLCGLHQAHSTHTVGRIMCVPHDWRMTIRDSSRGLLSKLKEQLRLAVERQDLVTHLEVNTRMTIRWIWDRSGTMLVCMSQLRRGKILHQEPGHDPSH